MCVSQKAAQIEERNSCQGRPGVDYKAPNMCYDASSCFQTVKELTLRASIYKAHIKAKTALLGAFEGKN